MDTSYRVYLTTDHRFKIDYLSRQLNDNRALCLEILPLHYPRVLSRVYLNQKGLVAELLKEIIYFLSDGCRPRATEQLARGETVILHSGQGYTKKSAKGRKVRIYRFRYCGHCWDSNKELFLRVQR